MQTITYRMDKQGPTGNYIQYSMINHDEKEYEKEKIYIYKIESLCYTENTTL